MIINFEDIKDEADRATYVAIRQVIDRIFMDTLAHYATEHPETKYSDEFTKNLEYFRNKFKHKMEDIPSEILDEAVTDSIKFIIVDLMNSIYMLTVLAEHTDKKEVKH